MRKLISTIVILLAFGLSYSQNPLPKGQSQLNFGVGFSGWGVPLYIGLDHGVHNDVTIGGELSFRSYREHWESYHYKHSIIGISGNFNYHFNRILNIPPTWDFYAGLNLGFYMWSSPNDYYGKHNSGLGIGAQIGGRYYFSKNVGVNLEFGSGNAFSGGKLGITIKL